MSVNKVILVGNVGKDPESILTMTLRRLISHSQPVKGVTPLQAALRYLNGRNGTTLFVGEDWHRLQKSL